MHDRSQQLATRAVQQVRDFTGLVRALSNEQLGQRCHGEKEGDTVGTLIMRTTAVYERLSTILDAVRTHGAARGGSRIARGQRILQPAGPRRGAPPEPGDPRALALRLEARGLELAERVRALSAAQLSRPLPMTVEGFDHMDKPVGMIVEYLLYCQADRLETIRLATGPERRREQRPGPPRRTARLCQSLEEHGPARRSPRSAEAVSQ